MNYVHPVTSVHSATSVHSVTSAVLGSFVDVLEYLILKKCNLLVPVFESKYVAGSVARLACEVMALLPGLALLPGCQARLCCSAQLCCSTRLCC